jgi:hypothetical protein
MIDVVVLRVVELKSGVNVDLVPIVSVTAGSKWLRAVSESEDVIGTLAPADALAPPLSTPEKSVASATQALIENNRAIRKRVENLLRRWSSPRPGASERWCGVTHYLLERNRARQATLHGARRALAPDQFTSRHSNEKKQETFGPIQTNSFTAWISRPVYGVGGL